MILYDKLLEQFGYNNPFFYEEIDKSKYSEISIKKELEKLIKLEKICRFEKGIYFIPTKTVLGNSLLEPVKVISKKYLDNGNGFITGLTIINNLGLSTQMPNEIDIYTNNESSKKRQMNYNGQIFNVKCARVKITIENIKTQSLLELMNCIDSNMINDDNKLSILDYYKSVKKEDIIEYSKYFPDKAIRNLVESGLIYDFA